MKQMNIFLIVLLLVCCNIGCENVKTVDNKTANSIETNKEAVTQEEFVEIVKFADAINLFGLKINMIQENLRAQPEHDDFLKTVKALYKKGVFSKNEFVELVSKIIVKTNKLKKKYAKFINLSVEEGNVRKTGQKLIESYEK